ncbi:MAG: hypothetical protein SFX73_28460 [Kofleriaceae bacterium]|nr:hypothetical protein [Kofleriaceae bacterium]
MVPVPARIELLVDVIGQGLPAHERTALRAAVEVQLRRCGEAWPELALPDAATAVVWKERATTAGALASIRGEDIHLASLCARGDLAALALLDARFLSTIGPAIARVRPGQDFIDEVRQIVREKLLVAPPGGRAKLVELAGHGDLGGLVRVVALRTALNLRRDDRSGPTVDDGLVDALVSTDHEQVPLALDRARVKRAVETALVRLDPRDRNLLRLQLLERLGIDEIGRIYDVHRATAARWLERLRERLYDETRRVLGEAGMSPTEQTSALRLVDSRLEISFERLLT